MRLRTLLLTTTALMPIVFSPALAGPEGGTVVGGAATISGARPVACDRATSRARTRS